MLPSVVPRLTTDSAVRVFSGVWKLFSFLRLPSQDGAPSLPPLSLFLSFIFFPTSFRRQWATFLGAWCPLLAFRSCFVEFTPRSNVLWWICGGESGLPVLFLHHLRTTPLKRPWCWERLKAGGEGDDRGWDGWMASPTQRIWVWVDSRSWWWTGRPRVLRFMWSQRVRHNWATELNWNIS